MKSFEDLEEDLLSFHMLSPQTWHAFEELFGSKGACGNCWCMYYRLNKKEFVEGKSEDLNKERMKTLVFEGKPTGLLAFIEGTPIGWCAVAPREDYPKLARSKVHKPIDSQKVWSITCFFIRKDFRRMGVSVALLKALINFAEQNNIAILEAYPTIPTKSPLPDSFAWIGLYTSFEKAGFQIVDQTSKSRPMVRYYCS